MITLVLTKMVYCGDHSEKIEEIFQCSNNMSLAELINCNGLFKPINKNDDYTIGLTILRQPM